MTSILSKLAKIAIKKLPLKRLRLEKISKTTHYLKEPKTPILVYHSVEPKNSKNRVMSKNIHNVEPKSLKKQLMVLKENYEVVFVNEILKRVKKGKKVRGLAAVTFDDGYKSVLKNALPILKKLRIPVTWYLSTKLITERSFWRDKVRFIINTERVGEFLTWLSKKGADPNGLEEEDFYWKSKDPDTVSSKLMDEMTNKFLNNVVKKDVNLGKIYIDEEDIEKLNSDLLRVGNHTHSHYVLSSLRKKEQKKEVKKAKKILEKLDVKKSNVISVPFGGKNTFNKDTENVCSKVGYEGVLTSSGRKISSATDGHNYENNRLPRLNRFMPSNNNPWFLVCN